MPSTLFEENIAAFDLNFRGSPNDGGVILISQFENSPSELSPQEFFALETAQRFQVSAVYFRYFDDGRESLPQIYIYDNTDGHLDGKEAEIHVKVWSGCLVPMFIIINKAEVKIYDARDKVQIRADELQTTPIDIIKLSGEVIHKFSSLDFATGLFWESKEYEKNFQFATSAYKDLIDGLTKVYHDFQRESNLDSHVALKLLVQCLLVKYLEERDEESGYFAKTYFKNNFKSNTFCEVIASGKLLDLLDKLSNDFNGKIFEWSEDEKAERSAIKKAKVKKLADYLDGNTKNDQYVLWRLYSFSHLPVELISSVYEELLGQGKKDTVYTPDMVASTLVDECMPLKTPKKNFRLIDVSCGSGIFLVKAYKRIIQWWRYDQWKSTGIMDKPDLATMKQLLKESIYGIDIQGDAVRLSVFSLALALLDDLDPKTIWTKLKFENLSKANVLEQDFFDFIKSDSIKDFDLVIGNPPFNPPDGINNGDYYKLLQKDKGYQCEIDIPDFNLSLIFLVEAMRLLKTNGLLCLIQPSGPLLYQSDEIFKKSLFLKYNLLQIIDFTRLGDILWGKANVATAAIFLQNSPPDNRDVVHITVQRTPANLKKLFLELDHYDFHFLTKASILSNPYIWKANAVGGGRIVALIEKLANLRTLGQFLSKKKEEGWVHGEGFIENKKGKSVEYITGYDFLPTESLTELGVETNQIYPCTVTKFHRKTNKKVFSAPHILIRKILGPNKIITCFVNKYLVFKSDILSIHAPNKYRGELEALFENLKTNNDLYRFYILTTSSRARINKATSIYDEDLLALPYPEQTSKLKLSKSDKILINDTLDYLFTSTTERKLEVFAKKNHLEDYSRTFAQTLNSVYKIERKKFRLTKILDAGKYYALQFLYSDQEQDKLIELEPDLQSFFKKLASASHNDIQIQRVLKYYSKDSIIISKPKNLKYWRQSVALRDADETFADYVKSGF